MRMPVLVVAVMLACPAIGFAQAGTAAQSAEPFKLGTFVFATNPAVGLVLRDKFVVDLAQANAAAETARSWPRRTIPADMAGVIAEYEDGLKGGLYAIVNDLVQGNALIGARPAHVREVGQVRTLAPIPRPRMIMNTAVNFYSHIAEGAGPEQRAKLVGGDQRQQADASDMIHSVGEVIEYASSLVRLLPGDIIGAGTSGGVGMGTSVRGEQVWLVAGDEISATIDGIGTLRHKVAAAAAPPAGTGSYLPPVSSYRRGRGAGGGGQR